MDSNFGLMDSNVETLPNPTLTLVEVSVSYCPLVTGTNTYIPRTGIDQKEGVRSTLLCVQYGVL